MLTHHQILALVAPYTRQGLHVDLAGSDRLQGRLLFKPAAHAGTSAHCGACLEVFELQQLTPERYRLTRTLTPLDAGANGGTSTGTGTSPGAGPGTGSLQARLVAEGTQHTGLLQRVQAVQREQQLLSGPGYQIALHHRLAGDETTPQLILTQGVADVDGLRLVMKVSGVASLPASRCCKAI